MFRNKGLGKYNDVRNMVFEMFGMDMSDLI